MNDAYGNAVFREAMLAAEINRLNRQIQEFYPYYVIAKAAEIRERIGEQHG